MARKKSEKAVSWPVNRDFMGTARYQANQFLFAAQVLQAKQQAVRDEARAKNSGGWVWDLIKLGEPAELYAPEIVCLAFAVELYIKALTAGLTQCEPRRIHGIVELFTELPRAAQDRIVAQWMAIPGAEPRKADWFWNSLEMIDRGFEEWRYPLLEGSLTYGTSFAHELIKILQAYLDDAEKR